MNCKGFCEAHPDLFIKQKPSLKIGKDVYFCKLCEKYVEIKQIIKNALFKFKNKCVCCKARFRVKQSISSRSNRQFCKCGCGQKLDKLDKHGRKRRGYINNHDKRKSKEMEKRKCHKCNTQNTTQNKHNDTGNVYPLWHPFGKIGFLCHNCYMGNRRRIEKIKKLFAELNYSFVVIARTAVV